MLACYGGLVGWYAHCHNACGSYRYTMLHDGFRRVPRRRSLRRSVISEAEEHG